MLAMLRRSATLLTMTMSVAVARPASAVHPISWSWKRPASASNIRMNAAEPPSVTAGSVCALGPPGETSVGVIDVSELPGDPHVRAVAIGDRFIQLRAAFAAVGRV